MPDPSPPPTTITPQARPVARDAEQASSRLGAAIAAVIAALPDTIRRASDLQRALSLDSALAWNLYRAANAESVLEVGRCVPGERAMSRFIRQAAKAGVSRELLDEAQDAFGRFENMVAVHAGDRETYESMLPELGDVGGPAREQFDLRQKRAAYRANRLIWGAQARIAVACSIMHPSARPGYLEHAFLTGEVDLRHARTGRRQWTRNRMIVSPDGPATPVPDAPVPIDPTDPNAEIGLLSAYCSKPIPRFRWTKSAAGREVSELVSTGLGNLGTITYFKGILFRGMKIDPPGQALFRFDTVASKPVEVLLWDVLLHKAHWNGAPPRLTVFSRAPVDAADEPDPLPIQERVTLLGSDLSRLQSTDVPDYLNMVRFALGRLGWSDNGFHIYRVRIEYPVMHSLARLVFQEAR